MRAAGPVFNDYTTVGWSALPPRHRLISAEPREVRFPDVDFTGVTLAEFLSDLAQEVQANAATLTSTNDCTGPLRWLRTSTPRPR